MKVKTNDAAVQRAIKYNNGWLVINSENLALAVLGTRAKARDVASLQQDKCKVINIRDTEIEVEIEQPKPVIRADINRESTIIRPCKRVWAIADANIGKKRKEIISLCVAEGIAYNTARTQYQQWFEIQKEMKEREAQQTK